LPNTILLLKAIFGENYKIKKVFFRKNHIKNSVFLCFPANFHFFGLLVHKKLKASIIAGPLCGGFPIKKMKKTTLSYEMQ